jgi:hypothetical protein
LWTAVIEEVIGAAVRTVVGDGDVASITGGRQVVGEAGGGGAIR